MSLVFYDTETTGTDTYFDQILQFAAVKTNADFEELDQIETRCRLLPHVVPAPGAMRVTRLRAAQLDNPQLPSHYEMVRGFRAKLTEWSPATFIGYNSLQFDEDLVRQALYKTLHNPYLTNRSGNCRSDAMRMALACSLFAPDVLQIPVGENGRPSFKLDALAPANGFKHEHAHDAMGDVRATIFICRLIAEKAPDVWSTFMRFSQKATVTEFIADEPVFCVTEFYFGKIFSYLVTVLGHNAENANEWYLYDLSVHPESLLGLSDQQLAARLGQSPKPVRRMKSNAVPVLFAADDAPQSCKGSEYGLKELERRAAQLKAQTDLCERLVSVHQSLKEEYPESPHIEKQIYNGFFPDSDEKLMDTFHVAAWPDRVAIIEKFQDPRLRNIGRRLVHIERPDLLSEDTCSEHRLETAMRLLGHGDEIPWLTLPKAIDELGEMLQGASGADLELLLEHDAYLRGRLAQMQQIVA